MTRLNLKDKPYLGLLVLTFAALLVHGYHPAAEDAEIYLELGREIANSSDWPSWKDGVEFKAVRDETESERSAR